VAPGQRSVGIWLLCICGMILVMISLGGATRLTGSGLSIMEWAPISGVLPPLSEMEWRRLFALYQQIPQYKLVNEGFGLEGFKQIFWLEWVHRLWGRLMGVAFVVPLVWFWRTGRVDRYLLGRLLLFFALGGLQGAVGWIMVASGFFPDATAVSPYRLVIHLALALVLYTAILWTALSVLRPAGSPVAPGQLLPRRLIQATAVLVCLTILAGGFVAGLRAGFGYNTFPLMAGSLVPEGLGRLSPLLRNLTENRTTVQFDHRVLATLTLLCATAAVLLSLGRGIRGPVRSAVLALGVAVATQYALGVWTLLSVIPVSLATAHQAVAVMVLTTAVIALHTMRMSGGNRAI
jgi:cytochrome c oxidase assembly protein subunit 15